MANTFRKTGSNWPLKKCWISKKWLARCTLQYQVPNRIDLWPKCVNCGNVQSCTFLRNWLKGNKCFNEDVISRKRNVASNESNAITNNGQKKRTIVIKYFHSTSHSLRLIESVVRKRFLFAPEYSYASMSKRQTDHGKLTEDQKSAFSIVLIFQTLKKTKNDFCRSSDFIQFSSESEFAAKREIYV